MINPPPSGPTNVIVVMTSTVNDQLVRFSITITSISLVDKAGNNATLYTNPSPQDGTTGNAEFMHLNGTSEPILTATVPQGIYPKAIVVAASCEFTNVTVNSTGGIVESTFAQGLCAQGTGMTTVNLPAPISISGSTMALSLNLQVAQSFTLNAAAMPQPVYTISPVFTLTPVTLSSQPNNEQNGKFTGIDARITSVDAATSSFMAQTPDGFSLTVNSAATTAFQGVATFSTLAVGTLVNMDIAIQPDASLLATRIDVDDLAAPAASIGPILNPGSVPTQFVILPTGNEGCTFVPIAGSPTCDIIFNYDNNSVFGLSRQFSNVQRLPFPATFDGPGMLLGQNTSVFSSGQLMGQGFERVTTATLMPQTLNGTVTAISNNNSFTVYTVALAPYDLIPTLQTSVGPINRLTNPNEIIVYVDADTRLLNSTPINAGSVLRFRGLIFNDNGTLRMDCGQINDGVPE
jgi:hypothetical protein